ncbi:hypothetical protein LMG28688_00599 [Paraburkholderia caffeinitolerans]|uniref:DUF1254 domain-containing protein n=1 Tax=Paraburkholderia caffeinitolerans TaxID=1723730 RepID=A0A6J5FEE9_9BURK|nr:MULTISPECIES: DUF1254 domain-containing protein [Paraburkholderia]CAB3778469.1 hypothetical protein LMG28688_00599 [Paraburkholderia caffeinitolerans]
MQEEKAALSMHALAAHRASLAGVEFPLGYPTEADACALRDELLFQRATQVYLWALPAVNLYAMKEASERAFGSGYTVFPVWKQRLDAKTIIPTPNSDVIYAIGYIDVGRDGPMVIDVPPKQQGILNDFWQRPIEGPTVDGKTYAGDVGFVGPDRGMGGKFLVLPPGYQGEVPDGYHVYRSRTNNVLVFWRAFFADPANLAPACDLIEQTRIHPLGQSAQPMRFPNASGVPLDMTYPIDGRFFDMLARFVNSETLGTADPDWRGMMAAIGIVKGQPFDPDARTREILDAAARTAFRMSRAMMYEGIEKRPGGLIYPDRHYVTPTRNFVTDWEWMDKAGHFLDLDSRSAAYSIIYATSPAMGSAVPGQGARFLTTFKDANGAFFDGSRSYRLHLPPDVPAANFWSATLYDTQTASGLDNGQPLPSIGSRDEPIASADGSYALYFGPVAPAGKERNWRRTVPGRGFFLMLRLYGPTQAFFSTTWKPADLERMD